LVAKDEQGKLYTVRYEAVNAMLLNEFLKEHRKNEEQALTIARLEQQIQALAAGVQKVNAHLEMINSEAQVAKNNH
jgi:Ni,Fe-hydrogenase maturation factor